MRAALAAPTELRGLPLGGRVEPGDIPTLQQLGLQPLPAGCGAGSRSSSAAAAPAAAAAASGGKGDASMDGTARGGEGEALRQLRRFVAQAAGAAGAAGGSGSAYGSNFASSIAPWLATGCLSPRRMLEDVKAALCQAGGAAATAREAGAAPAPQPPLTWVRFELLWRDFFRFMTLKYSSLSARQLGSGAAGAGGAAATAPAALAAAV